MKKSDVIEMLERLGATVPKSQPRSKWVVSECPFGPWDHDSGKSSSDVFGVKIEQGDPFCNCFACGFHGSATDMILRIKKKEQETPTGLPFDLKTALSLIVKAEDEMELDLDLPDYEETVHGGVDEVTVFDKWWIDTYPKATQSSLAMKYLREERKVDLDVIEYLDLRFDPKQKRICAPVLNSKDQYVGLHGRAIYDDIDPRYRMYQYKGRNNPQYWLGENWVDYELPLVVVEGFFDLAKVLPVWANCASPLFANPSIEKMRRMAGVPEFITFFDHGTGGDKGRERFEKEFGKTHIIKHVVPPPNRKDPGACNLGEIASVLAEHLPF